MDGGTPTPYSQLVGHENADLRGEFQRGGCCFRHRRGHRVQHRWPARPADRSSCLGRVLLALRPDDHHDPAVADLAAQRSLDRRTQCRRRPVRQCDRDCRQHDRLHPRPGSGAGCQRADRVRGHAVHHRPGCAPRPRRAAASPHAVCDGRRDRGPRDVGRGVAGGRRARRHGGRLHRRALHERQLRGRPPSPPCRHDAGAPFGRRDLRPDLGALRQSLGRRCGRVPLAAGAGTGPACWRAPPLHGGAQAHSGRPRRAARPAGAGPGSDLGVADRRREARPPDLAGRRHRDRLPPRRMSGWIRASPLAKTVA